MWVDSGFLKGHLYDNLNALSDIRISYSFKLQIKSGSWYFRLEASNKTELATFPRLKLFLIKSDFSQIMKAIFHEESRIYGLSRPGKRDE